MPYFKDTAELESLIGGFLKEASRLAKEGDEKLATMHKNLSDLGLFVRIDIKNTKTNILIDFTKDPFFVDVNNTTLEPMAVFTMNADTCHLYWLGKVNVASAIATKKMVCKGPITKVLKLLPLVPPLYEFYAKYLADIGRQDLLVS